MTIAKMYGPAMQSIWNKEIDYDTDTIKCMLCTASYVPNQDTHRYKSSVTNEVTGTGYTAGGVTLGSKTVNYDATTNVLTLDAADPSWTTVTITGIRYAVYYMSTGTDSTSPLICYTDFETTYSPSAANFTIVLPATGLVQGNVS